MWSIWGSGSVPVSSRIVSAVSLSTATELSDFKTFNKYFSAAEISAPPLLACQTPREILRFAIHYYWWKDKFLFNHRERLRLLLWKNEAFWKKTVAWSFLASKFYVAWSSRIFDFHRFEVDFSDISQWKRWFVFWKTAFSCLDQSLETEWRWKQKKANDHAT